MAEFGELYVYKSEPETIKPLLRDRTGESAPVRHFLHGDKALLCYQTGEKYDALCARLRPLFKKMNIAAVDTHLGYSCSSLEDYYIEFELEIFQHQQGLEVEVRLMLGDRAGFRHLMVAFGRELGADWGFLMVRPISFGNLSMVDDLLTPQAGAKFGTSRENRIRAMAILGEAPVDATVLAYTQRIVDYDLSDSEYAAHTLKLLAKIPADSFLDTFRVVFDMPIHNAHVRRMLLRCAAALGNPEIKTKMAPLAALELERNDSEESCHWAAKLLA